MLVLTRKQGESLQIGDDIEVKVLEVSGEQVKIGISAPKSIDIHRREIYLDILQQNSEASKTPEDLLKLLNESGTKK